MADASTIGASFSQYEGNAALGGYGLGAVKIDPRPIEDLGRYTFLYNKQMYDQRQKDAEEKILELAELSKYDPNDSIPEERQEAIDAYNKAVEAGRDYSRVSPATPEEKVQQYYGYKSKIKDSIDKLNMLQARNIAYKKRLDDIAKETNIDAKAIKQKRLDEDVRNTKGRQLPIEPLVNLEFPTIPPISSYQFDLFYKDPNTNQTVTIELPNMRNLSANSNLINTDFATKDFDVNSREFQSLSTEEKGNALYQSQLRSVYRKNGWVAAADQYNQFINQKAPDGSFLYRDADGNLDLTKMKSAPEFMRRTVEQFEEYNKQMVAWKNAIKNGLFTRGETGKPQGFDNTILFESDFDEINYKDGIDAGEMSKVLMLSQWKPKTSLRKIDATQTNEEIARGNLSARWTEIANQRENKETEKLPINQPAILFGKHIDRLKNFFEKNPGKELVVQYGAIDKETRSAIGFTDANKGDNIVYRNDGSFAVKNKKGDTIKVGTIEELKQGYIDAVKAGLNLEGVQSEGFQKTAERSFQNIFGTLDGNFIYDNWKKPINKQETQTEQTDDSKLSDAEYYNKYKKFRTNK